jgi:hypothetical protein
LWSAQAEIPIGEIMPAANLWYLSQSWYEGRLSPDWTPRSRDTAQQILTDAGFAGAFWSLP